VTNKCSDCGNVLTAEAELSRLKKLLHEVPDDRDDGLTCPHCGKRGGHLSNCDGPDAPFERRDRLNDRLWEEGK